ncbi:MAG: translation elongation factor Ts [Desulfobacterales bacterium]|nr:translation elongation factor Ts [Desulfobacterales bacterium]
MAEVSAKLVKELRDKTGAGMMDCKEALAASDGAMDKAVEFLRKKGLATAQKRAGRATSEGTIATYIHMGGKLGVMVEVNSETDFVAKNEQFQEFAKNIAMPRETGKPEKVIEKIVEGKLKKFFEDSCLLNQAYVRNPDITVGDLLNDLIAKMGENIGVKRFVRFQVGE